MIEHEAGLSAFDPLTLSTWHADGRLLPAVTEFALTRNADAALRLAERRLRPAMRRLLALLEEAQRSLPPLPARPGPQTEYNLWPDLHDACNLKCKYCFSRAQGRGKTMSLDTFRQGLWFLTRLWGRGAQEHYVGFCASVEPLYDPPLLYAAVEECRRVAAEGYPLIYGLNFNGTLWSQEAAQRLADAHYLGLSIDGPPEIHDQVRTFPDGSPSWDTIWERVADEVRSGRISEANITLTHDSLDPVRAARSLVDLGFREVALKTVRVPHDHPSAVRMEDVPVMREGYRRLADFLLETLSRGDDRYANAIITTCDPFGGLIVRLARQQRAVYRCKAAVASVTMDTEGNLYPCGSFTGVPEFRLGDVWSGLDPEAVARAMGPPVSETPSCVLCWARFLCGGPCTYRAWLVNGDVAEPDPVECAVTQMRAEEAIRFWALLQKKSPQAFTKLLRRVTSEETTAAPPDS